ncbi:hypothetical protein JG687_00004394 [Phytophthora cactorum]|uniref:Uncharacterized protein n=1 Tax=Phytophthora cactorum TaxID=29920 RepID=A0A8T1UP62_9STRA|nr:hypothetical protein JG687_00004394 [Phytophthora cactorum]
MHNGNKISCALQYQGEEHNSETSAHCGEVLSKKWETGGNALALFWTSVCLAYPGEIRVRGESDRTLNLDLVRDVPDDWRSKIGDVGFTI